MVDFCMNLGIQTNFILVIHVHTNEQDELANKVILGKIKKKLDDTKGLWAE